MESNNTIFMQEYRLDRNKKQRKALTKQFLGIKLNACEI